MLDYVGSIGNNAVSPQIAHPRWKTNTSLGYTSGAFTITGREVEGNAGIVSTTHQTLSADVQAGETVPS